MADDMNTPYKKAVHMIIHSIINGDESYVFNGFVRWGKVEKDLWDLESLLSPSKGDIFDPVCRSCGDPLTAEELICDNCRNLIEDYRNYSMSSQGLLGDSAP